MHGSVTLHPRLGLNARLATYRCPLCGEIKEAKELFLLGCNNTVENAQGERRRLRDDEKLMLPPQPCETCQDYMKEGVILVMAHREPNGDTRLEGPFVVVTDAAITRCFEPEMAEKTLKKRAAYLDREAWLRLGLPTTDIKEKKS